MSHTLVDGDVQQDPALLIADLRVHVEHLERLIVGAVKMPGELIWWTGTAPAALTGVQEVKPCHLLANGAQVLRADWPLLYEEIGDKYGSPTTNAYFVLPNFVDKTPWPKATSGARGTVNATGGAATVALAITNMPAHSHSGSTATPSLSGTISSATAQSATTGITVDSSNTGMAFNNSSDTKSLNGAGGNYSAPLVNQAFDVNDPGHTHNVTGSVTINGSVSLNIASEGSGTAHENMPPFTVIEGILVYAGLKAVTEQPIEEGV